MMQGALLRGGWWAAVVLVVESIPAVADAVAPTISAQDWQDLDWTGEIAPGATLRVFTTAGSITVRQGAGREARVRGRTLRAGREELRYESSREGRDVVICAVREGDRCSNSGIRSRGGRWSGERRARADFTVELPRDVALRIASGSGDLSVEGATAEVHATSGSGRVTVGAGAVAVRVSTGSGDARVEDARGPVRVSTGSGRVTIATAQGGVEASTGSGSIDVSMASLAGVGDLRFSSGSGSITLRVPDDFSARLSARTGRGSVQTDFPMKVVGTLSRHRVSGTIGEGGRDLRLSTGSGNIRILRAGR